ncbi:MAG: radical SAM protein [Bacteroidales bacterium]|nr:radical SAM protein [Bacteroidales bacterium]
MLRFDDMVFGPIHSRRLGSSLGINLLPRDGKLCNFDCVYCECGWNRDGRSTDARLPQPSELRAALEAKLLECREAGTGIDSITFSGNGEPTLNPDFPEMVDIVLELRDRYCPGAVVSVLSNATSAGDPAIADALRKVDNPILKLDAPDNRGVELVNRPAFPYDIDKIVDALKAFGGNFILQTMFLRWDGYDTAEGLEKWMDIVRSLHPRSIMVYSLDRETPQSGLRRYSAEEMAAMVRPLVEEGFKVQINA